MDVSFDAASSDAGISHPLDFYLQLDPVEAAPIKKTASEQAPDKHGPEPATGNSLLFLAKAIGKGSTKSPRVKVVIK